MGIGAVQRQSIVSLVLQIAYTAIGFLSTMYFAHAVGAGVLGTYFLFLAYFGIIGLVTDGGFGQAAIKRISEGEEQDAYFSAFFVLRSLLLAAAIFGLFLFKNYFIDFNSEIFVWLLLGLIISLLYGTVSYGIAGCGKMGIYATGIFINNVSAVLIQVAAVFLGFRVAGLAGGFAAGMLVAGIIQLRFLDLRFVRFGWRHVKSLSTFSLWLFLISSGMLVFSYTDTVLIGYFKTGADVGVYRVALQLTTAATFTTHAILQTIWPKVSRWSRTGEILLIEESLSRAFSYSLVLAIPVLAGGVLLGDRLLYFFYGAEFTRGYLVLVIFLVVQVVNVFQYFFTNYLSALDHQKDSFKVTAAAALANIILNFMLIPVIGITGAAVATLVTMVLNALLARQILSKIIKIRVENDSFFSILKASLVMSALIAGYRLVVPLSSWWLTLIPVILGGIVYGILLLKFDAKIRGELTGILTQMNFHGIGFNSEN